MAGVGAFLSDAGDSVITEDVLEAADADAAVLRLQMKETGQLLRQLPKACKAALFLKDAFVSMACLASCSRLPLEAVKRASFADMRPIIIGLVEACHLIVRTSMQPSQSLRADICILAVMSASLMLHFPSIEDGRRLCFFMVSDASYSRSGIFQGCASTAM